MYVWLPLLQPMMEPWPATQACALTGNWTGQFSVHRLALNPLSNTSRAWLSILPEKYSYNDSYVGSNRYLYMTLTICQAYISTLTTQLRDSVITTLNTWADSGTEVKHLLCCYSTRQWLNWTESNPKVCFLISTLQCFVTNLLVWSLKH